MTEKNLELLRPFDLEAAKAGTLLCSEATFLNGEPAWKYAAGPDASGRIVAVKISDGNFAAASRPEALRMAPLCWVEGRPVYKGDVLFYEGIGRGVVVGMKDGNQIAITYDRHEDLGPIGALPRNLTWTPPKVKREGWGVMRVGRVSCTREEAEAILKQYVGSNILSDTLEGELRVARIEWEEDVKESE